MVRKLSVELARTLGYRQEDLEAIEIGALLHDIGKSRVPERILNKPGPLTAAEWEELRGHPVASDSMLSELELHPFVRQIARSTHERIDGKGYPDGLTGEEIPLPARIVLVADAFDALARDRPHRPARPVSEALEELRANAGPSSARPFSPRSRRYSVTSPSGSRPPPSSRACAVGVGGALPVP